MGVQDATLEAQARVTAGWAAANNRRPRKGGDRGSTPAADASLTAAACSLGPISPEAPAELSMAAAGSTSRATGGWVWSQWTKAAADASIHSVPAASAAESWLSAARLTAAE